MKNIFTLFLCITSFVMLSTFALLSINPIEASAQDVIYNKDQTKINAKVLEIGTANVKYKPSSNPEGPVYLLPKSEISTIVFQNGTFEVFSQPKSSRKRNDSLSVNFCRNFIAVDIAEFAGTSIGMVYEHTFGKKGMFALRIPFAVGLNQNYYYSNYPDGKIFSTGLDFLYFPTGQGKLRYYVAPYFEWGLFRYSYYYPMYEKMMTTTSYPYYSSSNGQHFAGGIKHGLLYQPTRHFSVSSDFGFGLKKDETSSAYDRVRSHFKANIIIGYRF